MLAAHAEGAPVFTGVEKASVEKLPVETIEGDNSLPAAEVQTPPPGASDDAPWPTDETVESAFLAASLERSGTIAPPVPVAATREENDDVPVALPPLDSLMNRIPAEVRETLEDLFRAKFTAVRRVPGRYLNKN